MKFLYLILIGCMLIQCTNSKTQETSKADSIFIDSSSVSQPKEDNATSGFSEIVDEPKGDSLASAINNAMDSLASAWSENPTDYYTISSNLNGYENGSESTWYFDKSLNLKYFTGRWDSEGTSGSYSYYFESENLLAASTEDDYQEGYEKVVLHRGFKPVYGFSKKADSESEEKLTYLYESSYNSINNDAKSQYSRLIDYIRSNADSATFDNGEVNIHLETTVNYGFDFTSKEDYYISKVLFDKLIKN